ncbi:hypothetical protein ACFXKF_15800 [Streptomyces scopuliridis]|uniref:phosphotriesterase family protein n=1 Tax=Streptomyces scopuliridis TaxID=452529 RepID=UPI00368E1693
MSPAQDRPGVRAPGGRTGRTVRTVLGEVDPAELGICDAHDHLFLRSPMLPGQEPADPDAAAGRLREFRALGGRAVVQWTPYGMGRRPADLAALSRAEGVHVVAATGLHQAAHYDRATLRSAGEDPAGAYLAFDGPSRAHHATDWRLPEQLAVLAVAGFGDRLLLGGDTTVPETPGMPHLLRRLRPRLEVTLGERMVERMLVANPARALSFGAP